jgi:type I restriction enzyme S subunit
MKIPVPPPSTMAAITEILSTIDAKIEHNNELIKMLEEQAQLVYDYWFMQFDFPDENGRPYCSSGGKMVWSNEINREIPPGRRIWLETTARQRAPACPGGMPAVWIEAQFRNCGRT